MAAPEMRAVLKGTAWKVQKFVDSAGTCTSGWHDSMVGGNRAVQCCHSERSEESLRIFKNADFSPSAHLATPARLKSRSARFPHPCPTSVPQPTICHLQFGIA